MNTNKQSLSDLSDSARAERLATCERRKSHAEQNLKFWMRELGSENDDIAKAQLAAAHRQLGDINARIHELRSASFVISEFKPIDGQP